MADKKHALDQLVAHIEFLASCERVFGPGGALYAFGSHFLPDAASTTRLPRGRRKGCYANACAVAIARNDLVYVEGYAIDATFPVPIEHAWLVDASGRVLDPTWKDVTDSVYFGIPFKRDFVTTMLAHSQGVCGLLSNWKLMRQHFGTPNLLAEARLSTKQFPVYVQSVSSAAELNGASLLAASITQPPRTRTYSPS